MKSLFAVRFYRYSLVVILTVAKDTEESINICSSEIKKHRKDVSSALHGLSPNMISKERVYDYHLLLPDEEESRVIDTFILKLNMKKYIPEIGQIFFGQPYKEFSCTDEVFAVLRTLQIAMENKGKSSETPFDNSGERFKNEVFECNAYDWSECSCNKEKCTCGWQPQPYNFKWKYFEVSWYKHLGRGTTMNRKISKKELAQMWAECVESLK